LGEATKADRIEIRWPSGTVDTIKGLTADGIYLITEGKGVTGRQPVKQVVRDGNR
jgi:hypothetical protein